MMSPVAAERRFALLYGGLFLALGAQMAFLPLWLEEWGLDAAEIGRLTAFAVGVRIVAGLALPTLADRLGRPREAMGVLAALGALAAAGHLGVDTRWGLYALTAAMAAAFAGLIPLSDAHGYAAAERIGFSYRRARSVGSATFLAATFLTGVAAAHFGPDAVVVWIAAAMALAALGGWAAPSPRARPAQDVWRGAARLAFTPRFALFLAAAAAVNASHAVYYVYGSLHWESLGYSKPLIGALWAWGVAAEILLFAFGGRLIERLGPERALALAGGSGVLRWSVMAFDPTLAGVAALQTLHAGTFALAHLAALAFISREAPPDRIGSAQGLFSAVAGGLGMLAATLFAAQLYPVAGGGAYALSAGAAGLGALLALRLNAMGRGAPPAARASSAHPQSSAGG